MNMDQNEKIKRNSAKNNLYCKNLQSASTKHISKMTKNHSHSSDLKSLNNNKDLFMNKDESLFSIMTDHQVDVRSISQNNNDNVFINSTTSDSSSSSLGSLASTAKLPINNALPTIVASKQKTKAFLDPFLGQSELERLLPKKELKISILTWNMSSRAPENYTSSIERLLRLDVNEPLSDVYVIGLQETPKSDLIQCQMKMGIQAMLGPHFVLLRWEALGVLHCSIWIRRELLWSCTTVRSFAVNSRPVAANRIKTKGALALAVNIFGNAFLFINTHLSAHTTNLRTRMNQMDKIQQSLGIHWDRSKHVHSGDQITFRNPGESDYIFWFGDLNFRLERPLEQVMKSIQQIATENNFDRRLSLQLDLMQADQLSNLMKREIIFANFHEALFPPPFLPTYKCKERSAFKINTVSLSSYSGSSSASGASSHYTTASIKNAEERTEMTPSTSSSEIANDSPTAIRKVSHSHFPADAATAIAVGKSEFLNDANEVNNNNNSNINNNSNNDNNNDMGEMYELDHFEYNTLRVPSFTDRILYQEGFSHETVDAADAYPYVCCDIYTTIPDLFSSDHKPVYAKFKVTINSAETELEPLLSDQTERERSKQIKRTNKDYFNTTNNKGVGSFFRLKKRQIVNRNNELLNGRALSVSTSSLLVSSTQNISANENLTKCAIQRAFNYKIADLNAGEFDRQIYIDGLKLRNAVFTFRENCNYSKKLSGSVLTISDNLETAKSTVVIESRKNNISSWQMFKSRSLDSTIVSNSGSTITFMKSSYQADQNKSNNLNDSINFDILPKKDKIINDSRGTIVSAPIINRKTNDEKYTKNNALNSPAPPPSPQTFDLPSKSSLCNIS